MKAISGVAQGLYSGNQSLTAEARKPVSAEIVAFAERLAGNALSLSERVDQKLQTVTRSQPPACGNACCEDSIEYPSLFFTLRDSFQRIESALDAIENTLSRTEL